MRISDWSSDVCSSDLTYVKVAFFAAAFICFPVFLTQLWRFVAPGLYKHEKSAFLPFLVAPPFLFFLGGALVYYIIFPMAVTFFIGFEVAATEHTLPIQLAPKVNEYLSLLRPLLFAFGLCFPLPVVMTLQRPLGLPTPPGLAAQDRPCGQSGT